MLRAPVGQVVSRYGGDHHVAKPHLLCGEGHIRRLVGIEGRGTVFGDVTETAMPCAVCPHDEKGGGVLLVALMPVGAVCLVADGVQFQS